MAERILALSEAIADECAVFQRGWSHTEEMKRRYAVHDLTMSGNRISIRPRWNIPVVHIDKERQGRAGESADEIYRGGGTVYSFWESSDPFLPYMRE